ncbi:MAG: DUF1819 family protein [Saprospiraceae bacterium]
MFKLKGVEKTYSYSFTAASMKFLDFMRLVRFIEDYGNHLEDIDPNVIMLRSNNRTNQREFHELMKRYKLLTENQKELLSQIDVTGQRQIAMIGICKAYPFIQDFIIEVVREKYLSLDFQLTDGDYQTFINRKLHLHTELEGFSDSTEKKARQVVWKMLEESGIINNTKERHILPQFVDRKVINAILSDDVNLLKIFLMTDRDIKQLSE